MFKFIITNGEPLGAEYQLKTGENIIGRSRSTDIRLSSLDVSGRHARVIVENDKVYVENLSQYHTFIDGVAVDQRTPLTAGQCLKMGVATEFRLEDGLVSAGSIANSERNAAVFDDERDTGEIDPGAGSAGAEYENDLTMEATAYNGSDDEDGATRAMHTRAATPDEIEHLKEREAQHVKNRMFMIIGAVVVVLTLGVIFRPRSRPPELEITWPATEQGVYQNRFEASLSGGREQGEYDIRYPDNGTFKRSDAQGGFVLSGFVGRDRDTPMRIIVQEEQDLRFAVMHNDAVVADWMEMIAGSGGTWRIDKPSSLALFFGDKNGIPYVRTSYLRDDKGASWFGIANIFRHGRRRIVVRAESPAVEQSRVENLLTSRLVYVADDFEFSYWPYIKIGENTPVDKTLAQVRRDMERVAPGTWMSIDKMLCGLLSRVIPGQDTDTEKECLRLLRKLRENEALWFNSQQLAFESAMFRGDLKRAKKIAVFTKGVFSDMNDQRYYTVRKWNVEL